MYLCVRGIDFDSFYNLYWSLELFGTVIVLFFGVSTVVFRTELGCCCKQKRIKQGYIVPKVRSCYKNSKDIITNCMTVTKYKFLKWLLMFYIVCIFFRTLSPTWLLRDLTIWVKRRIFYKKQEQQTYLSRVHYVPLVFFSFFFWLFGAYYSSFLFSVLCFLFYLSSFCVWYSMSLMSLDYPFLIVHSVFPKG